MELLAQERSKYDEDVILNSHITLSGEMCGTFRSHFRENWQDRIANLV